MTTVAKLKDGNFLLLDSVDERKPAIVDNLIAYYPFDGTDTMYIPKCIRYIKDWVNGSTANIYSHWLEIKALDYAGNNVAYGKTSYLNGTTNSSAYLLNNITDDSNEINYSGMSGVNLCYQLVDLGALYLVKEIKVWHYYFDGRKYHNSKTEVSDDGVRWYPVFDSAIEGEYNETSSGHTINLENLGATCKPEINTATRYTPDGIAISRASNNVWSGTIEIYNNYPSTIVTSRTVLNETYMGYPIVRLTFKPTDSTTVNSFRTTYHSHGMMSSSSRTYVANTYTYASVFWRCNRSTTAVEGSPSNIGGWIEQYTVKQPDGWNRSFSVWRDTVDRSDRKFFGVKDTAIVQDEVLTIDFAAPMIEESPSLTYYTTSSHSNSSLKIRVPSINLDSSPFTLVAKVRSGDRLSYLSDHSYTNSSNYYMYAALLTFIHSTGGRVDSWFADKNAPSKSIKLVDGDAAGGAWITVGDQMVAPSDECYIAYVFNGNYTTSLYLLKNGVLYTSSHTRTGDIGNLTSIVLSGYTTNNSYLGHHVLSNVALYSSALTTDEFKQLVTRFKILPDGNTIAPDVKENPLNLPSDVRWIPLDNNASDRCHVVVPLLASNVLYEDGAAWLGNSITNYWNQKEVWACPVPDGTTPVPYSITVPDDQQYTLTSRQLYYSDSTSTNPRVTLRLVYTDSTYKEASTWGIQLDNRWHTYRVTVTKDSGKTIASVYGWVLDHSSGTGKHCIADRITIHNRPYYVPHFTGSLSNGHLKYKFSDFGINPNTDSWTLFGFFLPQASLFSTTNRVVAFEVGNYCDVSSTSITYDHRDTANKNFGLIIYDAQTVKSGPSRFTLADADLSSWVLPVIRYDASTTTLSCLCFGASSGKLSSSNIKTWSSSISDVFHVGSYAWDGGAWENFIRDVCIAKRALSDSELEQIYRGWMKKNSTQSFVVQNQIKEISL